MLSVGLPCLSVRGGFETKCRDASPYKDRVLLTGELSAEQSERLKDAPPQETAVVLILPPSFAGRDDLGTPITQHYNNHKAPQLFSLRGFVYLFF